MTERPLNRPETALAFAFRSRGLPEPTPEQLAALADLQTLLSRADDLIESLITVVDTIRGDSDLEAGGDAEPDTEADTEPLFADLRGGTRIGAKQ